MDTFKKKSLFSSASLNKCQFLKDFFKTPSKVISPGERLARPVGM